MSAQDLCKPCPCSPGELPELCADRFGVWVACVRPECGRVGPKVPLGPGASARAAVKWNAEVAK